MGSFMKLFGFFNIDQPFSLKHWTVVLNDPAFLSALRNSFAVGIGTAVFGLILYSFLAYVLLRTSVFGKSWMNLLVWLPWAVPGILLGLAYLWLFLSAPVFTVFYGTFAGLFLVLVIKEMPIGVHMMKAGLVQVAEELEQVGRVCGARWLYTYWRITLPLVSPVLVSILAIVFITAVRDIDTIILISTSSVRPLSLLMMEYSMAGEVQAASIIGVILSAVAVVVAILARRYGLRVGRDAE
jgi:iron(III) transport system permease protein